MTLTYQFVQSCASKGLCSVLLLGAQLTQGCPQLQPSPLIGCGQPKALPYAVNRVPLVQMFSYTLRKHRKRGLPRPSNCPPNAQPSPRAQQQQQQEVKLSRKVAGRDSEGSSKAKQQVKTRGRKVAGNTATPPPEFDLI